MTDDELSEIKRRATLADSHKARISQLTGLLENLSEATSLWVSVNSGELHFTDARRNPVAPSDSVRVCWASKHEGLSAEVVSAARNIVMRRLDEEKKALEAV